LERIGRRSIYVASDGRCINAVILSVRPNEVYEHDAAVVVHRDDESVSPRPNGLLTGFAASFMASVSLATPRRIVTSMPRKLATGAVLDRHPLRQPLEALML